MISSTPLRRGIFFVIVDLFLSFASLTLAYHLRFNFEIEARYLESFFLIFSLLVVIKILAMSYFKLYQVSWRFVSLHDAKKLFYAHVLAYVSLVAIYYSVPHIFTPFPRSVLIIDLFLSMTFIGVLRISKRLIIENANNAHLTKTLILGVTPFSQTLLTKQNDFYICAIVDDSEMLIDTYISNILVKKMEDIEALVEQQHITSVIIAKEFEQTVLLSLYKRLNTLEVYDIKVASLEQKERRLKRVTIEDLLARHPQDLDQEAIAKFLKGKIVLITGAGGSIGSEIARQCAKFEAKSLILVDNSEFNLYQIGEQLPEATLRLLSITDKGRLQKVFESQVPDIVIHAAAYKHVPLCEENKEMAVYNNVLGSKNVIDLSIKYAVKKVVIVSTDKAVRPTNVMGATKRVVELYANNVEAKETEIVAVRFGNVLGSSGSVIPKFKKQIEEGGPITITHPEITRYFMLIPEACQLVLQTATIAKGGELFILDMGEPIKIVDLANQMLRMYRKEHDIELVFTGLRPGEKLYEELLLDESEEETQYASIFISKPTAYDITQLTHDIEVLLAEEDKVKFLQKIVPEFVRKD